MREVVATKEAPQAIGPYSQAVKAKGFVFVSHTGEVLPERVSSSLRRQRAPADVGGDLPQF